MTSTDLRIVFAGTPDFAAGHLDFLCQQGLNIIGVLSQPDRPSGRGKTLRPTPVKAVAQSHDLNVMQPDSLDEHARDELQALAPDVLIVVAFGMILSEAVLKIPTFGCINVHASLLPRWRGAAPIERAILSGDEETGISIMQMDEGLDTGDVLLEIATPITDSDDGSSVTSRLQKLGCEGLLEVLNDLQTFQASAIAQDDALATYAAKLSKEEARINWAQPAQVIQRQVQAFFPRSPAWVEFNGDRLRIIQARQLSMAHDKAPGTILSLEKNHMVIACGTDALIISSLQLPGKKAASVADIRNGHPNLFQPDSAL